MAAKSFLAVVPIRDRKSRSWSLECGKMPILRVGLLPWFRKTVVDPFMQVVRSIGFMADSITFAQQVPMNKDSLLVAVRGAEPKQLAFSTALGLTLGIFPVCGVTVILCGMAITLLGNRCNAPSILLANFVATPIELSLIIPFLRLGELISGGPQFPLTSDALKKVVLGQASWEVVLSIYHALLGWFLAAPLILGFLFLVSLPFFELLINKFGSLPSSSPKMQLHPFSETKERDV